MHVIETERVARKPHPCNVCNVGIKRGETYQRTVTMDGADILTWKNCLPCRPAIDQAWIDGYDDAGYITAEGVIEWAAAHPENPAAIALVDRLKPRE